MNMWGIPEWLENEVRARDQSCVYCGVQLIDKVPAGVSRKQAATWEHIINDAGIVTRENIVRCCTPCNSSKGQKTLTDWLGSAYCIARGISADTVSDVVKQALMRATPE
jgi:hypothetical protein